MRLFLISLLFLGIASAEQKEFLPTYTPGQEKKMCFQLEGDFIYMKPKVDNQFFAVHDDHVISPNFKYSPGFKAVAGFYFPRWTWDLIIRVTNLESDSSKSIGRCLPLLWYDSIQRTPFFQTASAHFDLNFTAIDIEVGKAMCLTKKIICRIHGGIKNTLIKQKLKTTYKNSDIIDNISFLQSKNIFKNRSNGTGIRIGFDTKWKIAQYIDILADPSITFMLTSFDTMQNYYNTLHNFLDNSLSPSNLKYKEHIWVVRPYGQILFGIGYSRCFNSFSFNFKAGYEFNYFWEFNLNRRYHILANSYMNKGDLSFQGLNLALGFDF